VFAVTPMASFAIRRSILPWCTRAF
jgi:hypothetical protein